jgi:hypothetical protein
LTFYAPAQKGQAQVNKLETIRYLMMVLGLLGISPAVSLMQLSYHTAHHADRRSARQMATLFFWLTIGMLIVLAGGAGVSAWLLFDHADQSLWPGVVQLGAMVVFDLSLFGMLRMNREVERERSRRQ